MENLQMSAAATTAISGLCFVPEGLSDDDRHRITDCIRTVAPGWHMDLEEDAFDQPCVIVAPAKADRLRLAFLAYRINQSYLLDEVREGTLRDAGEYSALDDLLDAIKGRLAPCSAIPVEGPPDRLTA